ncbi:MAG: hypothetical protein ACD_36C00159G0003 [uncultured bacterium]|nr:MAG: hypothetical protein ACD_36C00159G0003 [uncultured bacterium]
MNNLNEMTTQERLTSRRRYILDRLKEGDLVPITDISKTFQCTPDTIRRDLTFLRKIGIDVATKRGIISGNSTHRASIVREILFPSTYKDAGVSILSYFARVLEEKYPNTEATVAISQKGDNVTLKIESDEGELERIEKTLSEYGQVVKGVLLPSKFLPSTIAALELKNKLEIVRMELRLKEQSYGLLTEAQNQRILSLEDQVSDLRNLIGLQLETVHDLGRSLSEIAKQNVVSDSVAKAIETISRLAESAHTQKNEKDLTSAILLVKKENEPLYSAIKRTIFSFSNSVAANLATPWVVTFLNSLPK